MEILSGLFPIQTNSLTSFHQQCGLLLHQGTTFKEPLSFPLQWAIQQFRRQGNVPQTQKWVQKCRCRWPPGTGIWWPRAVLHKVILTCWGMQLRMQYIPPSIDIWWSRSVLHKSTWHSAECKWEGQWQSDPKPKMSSKLQMQMYHSVQASGGQEQYYIWSSWHVEECNWECSTYPPWQMHLAVQASGGQEKY